MVKQLKYKQIAFDITEVLVKPETLENASAMVEKFEKGKAETSLEDFLLDCGKQKIWVYDELKGNIDDVLLTEYLNLLGAPQDGFVIGRVKNLAGDYRSLGINPYNFKKIDEIGLSVRALNILKRAGYKKIEDILDDVECGFTMADFIKAYKRAGKGVVEEINEKLADLGFSGYPQKAPPMRTVYKPPKGFLVEKLTDDVTKILYSNVADKIRKLRDMLGIDQLGIVLKACLDRMTSEMSGKNKSKVYKNILECVSCIRDIAAEVPIQSLEIILEETKDPAIKKILEQIIEMTRNNETSKPLSSNNDFEYERLVFAQAIYEKFAYSIVIYENRIYGHLSIDKVKKSVEDSKLNLNEKGQMRLEDVKDFVDFLVDNGIIEFTTDRNTPAGGVKTIKKKMVYILASSASVYPSLSIKETKKHVLKVCDGIDDERILQLINLGFDRRTIIALHKKYKTIESMKKAGKEDLVKIPRLAKHYYKKIGFPPEVHQVWEYFHSL